MAADAAAGDAAGDAAVDAAVDAVVTTVRKPAVLMSQGDKSQIVVVI